MPATYSTQYPHQYVAQPQMSYHRSGQYGQWSLTPTNINPSGSDPSNNNNPPLSASPFSPTYTAQQSRNASEIIPRLYISDLSFAENPVCLSQYKITHILSTLPDKIFQPPPTLLPMQPARMQIKVEDLPFSELAAHLPTTTAWIRDALSRDPQARVLVHCVEGISRSVSVVAAFLMAQYNWTPTEAIQYIKSKRRVAEPNFGFVQQLHEYGKVSLGRS